MTSAPVRSGDAISLCVVYQPSVHLQRLQLVAALLGDGSRTDQVGGSFGLKDAKEGATTLKTQLQTFLASPLSSLLELLQHWKAVKIYCWFEKLFFFYQFVFYQFLYRGCDADNIWLQQICDAIFIVFPADAAEMMQCRSGVVEQAPLFALSQKMEF